MRGIWFAVLTVVAVALGLVALFQHRPGSRPVATDAGQPARSVQIPGRSPPAGQGSEAAATRDGRTSHSMPHTGGQAAGSGTGGKNVETASVQGGGPNSPAPSAHGPAPKPAPRASAQQAAATATVSGSGRVQAPGSSGPTPLAATGDSAAGRQAYRKCLSCHSLEAGRNMIGPTLAGIIGRKAGAEPGFNYSPAMKQANITWTPQTLAAYLTDPQKSMPGNRMPFPGLKSAHERNDVVAYLVQTSGGAPGGVTASPAAVAQPPATQAASGPPSQAEATHRPPPRVTHGMPDMPDIRYTLRSGIADGQMVFIGVGGAIDGQVNPVLTAAQGQIVQVTLINGEGAAHDVVFPDQSAQSPRITGTGASTTIAFRAEKAGDFLYYCSVPGHRLAGMEGKFAITPRPAEAVVAYADIARDPADLPGPIGERGPQTVRIDLVTVELEGRLAEGTSFGYWTFNGKVPGPFVRARVGDRIEVHLKNSADSSMVHSVDFHAATGPGGGAAVLQVNPGGEKTMTFKALVPGLYVYHGSISKT